jgi:hypothetical protein
VLDQSVSEHPKCQVVDNIKVIVTMITEKMTVEMIVNIIVSPEEVQLAILRDTIIGTLAPIREEEREVIIHTDKIVGIVITMEDNKNIREMYIGKVMVDQLVN